MPDIEDLQKLYDKNILSESEFLKAKQRLANKILQKNRKQSTRSGIIYILLAFFLGAVGIHNIYARYYKRGFFQFLLALLSPFMLFIPLIFTSIMALLELMFVNKSGDGNILSGNRKIIFALRILTILIFAITFSSSNIVHQDIQADFFNDILPDIMQDYKNI